MKTSSKIWLAIAGTLLVALGVVCICKPAATLSTLIGLGVIAMGAAYLFALFGITKFKKVVSSIGDVGTDMPIIGLGLSYFADLLVHQTGPSYRALETRKMNENKCLLTDFCYLCKK